MTGFDDRVRAAARELDRPDLLAEFLAFRAVEDAYHFRTATPDGRADVDAAVRDATARTAGDGSAPVAVAVPTRVVERSPEPDLEALADAAARGSEAARQELTVQLWPVIARYCTARVGRSSSQPTDVLVHDVLDAVLDGLPRRGDRTVLAFAYTTARECIIEHFRQNRLGVVRTPASAGAGALVDVLGMLPSRQRDIIVLRVLLGWSAEETAAHLGTTPGAVRVAQHQALRRIRGTGPVGD